MEVSLVIGIVACGSTCPAASADLGKILFVGKFQSQGVIGNTLNLFENVSFVVPSDISGSASIQVQHVFLLTPPVSLFFELSTYVIDSAKQHAIPNVEYESIAVQVSSISSRSLNIHPNGLRIHPNGNNAKCVGILGGTYADGTPVDMYDYSSNLLQLNWQYV